MIPDYEVFARAHHADQQYSGRPYYDAHLRPVINCLGDFGFVGYAWAASGALHDVVEDCMLALDPDERRQIVEEQFGSVISGRVWAVSGFGANRKSRNRCIYEKLQWSPDAKPLKCADRIINVEQTIADGSAHAEMYLKERADFEAAVRSGAPESMWSRLETGYRRLAI